MQKAYRGLHAQGQLGGVAGRKNGIHMDSSCRAPHEPSVPDLSYWAVALGSSC